jgi:regulator of sirC expression with transglutaminase-like and TPR domain
MIESKEIASLIRLVEDPDEHIFAHIRDKILSFGYEAIPFLEDSWEHSDYGMLFQARVTQLVHDIQFMGTKEALRNWIDSREKDLMQGAIIIAKYQYAELQESIVYDEIEKLKKAIWLEINHKQTAYEKIKIFNKVFYDHFHFRGDSKTFTNPVNSYINTVLESKKGNPLSLCLIYSVVAQALEMPVYGVNLPNHFVLAYMDEHKITSFWQPNEEKYGVLFYINAFSRGTIFPHAEITQFVKSLKIDPDRSHFEPCSNTQIIKRMLTNLVSAFQQVGNKEKVEELSELKSLFGLD